MKKSPSFNNRPNECITHEGKEFWISRSAAVVGVIIAVKKNREYYVLAEKRSSKMDAPGKWCVPCGYMDWNETGWEALTREVYEETSLYLNDYKNKTLECNNKEPFFVNTDPAENRQNIALSYFCILDFRKFSFRKGFPYYVERFKNEEIDEIKWIPVEKINKYDWAFDHDKRILMAVERLSEKIRGQYLKLKYEK
jgi:8-oxo-dGTP pyrophosphatase MutT (NUDIX family)